MKRNRGMRLLLATGIMSAVMGMTAFAASWKTGAESNQNRWWYDYEDGTYAKDEWQWIDGNQDGTAECYYFDGEGWMVADTVTPDGYQVDENGAWTEHGNVVTKAAVESQNTQNGQNVKNAQDTANSGHQLIVYFSRTGTTERAAKRIQELTGADLVKIEPEQSYPSSYEATLSRAQQEQTSSARPAVTTVVNNMDQYDTIYVGYPIWYGTAPMPVFTFLESYDLSGKTLVPFCTSGSSGISTSMQDIRRSCPDSDVKDGRRVNDVSTIAGWLSGLGLIQ